MRLYSKNTLGVALLAIVALTVGSLPSFGIPSSQQFQVSTNKNNVHPGDSVMITATVKHGTPNCVYSTLVSVTGPGGVSAAITVSVQAQGGGNGHTSVTFPSDFPGAANTNTPGTYSVSATFTCGYYSSGAASTSFTVASPGALHYQVMTNKKDINEGQSLKITATTIQAVPDCTYSVLLTVTGPGGSSATDTIALTTQEGGNGHASATFPDDFSGGSTNSPGSYTVTATFACGYATGADTTTFSVDAPPPAHYAVAAIKGNVRVGQSVTIVATAIQAVSSCPYSVLLTVTNPKGHSATDTVTLTTGRAGNGFASASFPADFTGGVNTDRPGTYTVTATFACGYATGSASTTFSVTIRSGDDSGDNAQ